MGESASETVCIPGCDRAFRDCPWQLYIIEANDHSLYTGITTDVKRRFSEHTSSRRGAKYFNGRTPLAVRYIECFADRSTASKREYQIKSMSSHAKRKLVESVEPSHLKYWQSMLDIGN